jgi:hypothetical protein
MIELVEMYNNLKKFIQYMESITSIPERRNNTNNLTTSNGSLFNYSDLSVGVVHYNMEVFGEN